MYNSDFNCISNALSLKLEEGDVVYMCLPKEHVLAGSSWLRNSGFLLFPV